MNIRLLFAGLLIALVHGSCVFQSPPVTQPVQVSRPHPPAPQNVNVPHDTLCIAAVGDIMLGTSYPNANGLPPDSAKNSFNAVQAELRKADVTTGNLEGTLLDDGDPAVYKTQFRSKGYLFRMPVKYAGIIKSAGFNVLSMANNHVDDFSLRGRLSTMHTLDSLDINYAGLLKHPTAEFEVSGVKYGFCAFAPNSQTVALLDLKNAKAIVSDLKTRCDIVLVSFHGGGEGAAFEHVPCQDEIYVGENRGNVNKFAHAVIDAGADIVLGNGPHVNRAMELYKNRLIAYSLGNFCTYKCVSVDGVCGLSSLLKVYLNKKGEFLNGRIIALQQSHVDGLKRDSTGKVITRIKYLTNIDFPQSGLDIADDGVITPLPQTVLAVGAGQE